MDEQDVTERKPWVTPVLRTAGAEVSEGGPFAESDGGNVGFGSAS